jgi:predicted O-methyltransferase YrrM
LRRYLANELQNPAECAGFVALLKAEGVRSYLEIGSRFGGSLWQVAQVLPVGSRLVSVDLEGDPELAQCIADITATGRDARLIVEDSTARGTIWDAQALGPYDAVLIDGNHAKAYVNSDWNNYGQMGRIVAFHDIGKAGETSLARKPWRADVPELWNTLRRVYRHTEIRVGKGGIGFGVLWRH